MRTELHWPRWPGRRRRINRGGVPDGGATYCPYCVVAANLEARGLGDRRFYGQGTPVICPAHEIITIRHDAHPEAPQARLMPETTEATEEGENA